MALSTGTPSDASVAAGPTGTAGDVAPRADGRGPELIETIDPRSGLPIGLVPDQDPEAVRAAIARARAGFGAWSALTYKQRTAHILRVRDRLLDRAEELAETICAETGKQRAEAVSTELMVVCEMIEWYAKNGERVLQPRSIGTGTLAHKKAWKRYEPLGVVGVISPWNYPFTLSMTPVLTALFAGNTVVLKPSEVTPTVGLAIGDLFAHDVWGEIVQVVTGAGATGEALVRGGVDKVVFTGSVRTGKRVMAAAADTLTPVLLELGGKDPMIVCADADLDRAAKGAVWGSFQNSGQTCMSVERIYVDESVHDAFVDRVLTEARRIRQDDHGGDIGSMTFAPQIDIVERHLADAVDKGATILLGGSRLDRPGLWFEPTVLVGVDHSMEVMTEETFGPVLSIMSVADHEEALRLANDSVYGLNSSVWSADEDLAVSLANRMQAGSVCINDCIVSYGVPGLPFGGVKESGIGRVHGAEGLREFSQVKSVMASRVGLPREPWWFPVPRGIDTLTIRTLRLRFGSTLSTRLKGLRGRP